MGASPDGLEIDPSEQQPHGLVEIKCPARAEKLSNQRFAYGILMTSMNT